MSLDRRRLLIEPAHRALSVVRQCALLSVNRSGLYYQPRGETASNLALMRLIDEQFLETPWYGSRQGSGANFPARASAPCCAGQTSSLKHRIPDCRRNSALATETSQCELSLADAMHQLDAGDRDRRIHEPLEAQCYSNALLHAPMVLLN